MNPKVEQARADRSRTISDLEFQLRAIQVQPGSELLCEQYRARIERLRQRNEDGVVYANRYKCRLQAHNPPLWVGGQNAPAKPTVPDRSESRTSALATTDSKGPYNLHYFVNG